MALDPRTKKLIEERDKQFTGPTPPEITPSRFKPPIRFTEQPLGRDYSRFFGDVYSIEVPSLEDQAARLQSGWERIGKAFPRVGVKVLSEIAQLPGYLGGAVAWGTTGFDPEKISKMVDNTWLQIVQDAEQKVGESLFPIYTPDRVKNGNIWANLASTSFWATEGADAIGFFLAMLVPGQLIKSAKLGKGAVQAGRVLGKGLGMDMTGGLKGVKTVPAVQKLLKPGTAWAGRIDDVSATMVNTIYESGAEAGEAYKRGIADGMTPEEAGQAASSVFRGNMGILLIPNALQQKWLFNAKFFGRTRRAIDPVDKIAKKNVLTRLFDQNFAEALEEVAKRPKWYRSGQFVKNAFKGVLSEGFFEEGLQYATSEYFRQPKASREEDATILDDMLGILDTYIEGLSETEMQKSIFLGGFLGSTMAAIHTTRQFAHEKRLLEGTEERKTNALQRFFGVRDREATEGLHKVFRDNYKGYVHSVNDLMVKDSEGDPITYKDEKGNIKYKLDPEKIRLFSEGVLDDFKQKQLMLTALEFGDTEAFDALKEQFDYKYMLPFIQQEGGYEVLLKHIDHLAEISAKEAEENDMPVTNLEEIKTDLLNKAKRFQEMYDSVNDSHPMSNINKITYDKKTERADFNEFSNIVKHNKLSNLQEHDYSIRRANNLLAELNNFPVSGGGTVSIKPTSDRLNLNTVSELKEAYKNINKETLTEVDKSNIQGKIKAVEMHINQVKRTKSKLEDLHNAEKLNKDFESYKASKQKSEEDSKKAELLSKTKLTPELQKLYTEAVKLEDLTVDNETYELRHSGLIRLKFTDEDKETYTLPVRIVGENTQGNLDAISEEDGSRLFINNDNTISYKGATYEYLGYDIIESPDQTQDRTQSYAAMNTLRSQIRKARNTIKEADEKIIALNGDAQYLISKLEELSQRERESLDDIGTYLTKSGTPRKISIKKLSDIGKIHLDRHLTSDQLRQALDQIEQQLQTLAESKNEAYRVISDMQNNVKFIKNERNANVILEITNLLQQAHDQTIDAIENAESLLNNAENIKNNFNRGMRAFNSQLAKMLGDDVLDAINDIRRNNNLTEEEKADFETHTISQAYQERAGELTDDEIARYVTLSDYVKTIRKRRKDLENEINSIQQDLEELKQKAERQKKLLDRKRETLELFNEKYLKIARDLKIAKLVSEKTDLKKDSPEEFIDEISRSEEEILKEREKDYEDQYMTPFDGTVESLMITTGQQLDAKDNPDSYRWYHFVYNDAGRVYDKESARAGEDIYALRTVSFENLEESNYDLTHPYLNKLKFWVGNKYMSYNEIIKEPNLATRDKLIKEAKEDIKVVVVLNNEKQSLVLANENGVIPFYKASANEKAKAKELIFTSLPKAEPTLPSGRDRFSLTTLIATKEEEYKKSVGELTDEVKEQIKVDVLSKFDDALTEYEETRKVLKKESKTFKIARITAGAKNFNNASDIDIMEATNTKNASKLRLYIKSSDSVTSENREPVKISNNTFSLRKGLLYLAYKNRYEFVRPKTLAQTNDVDNIFNLFRFLATESGKIEDLQKIEEYLKQILFFNSKRGNDFRLSFRKRPGRKVGFDAILFGNSSITRMDLVNNENVQEFKKYLATKYWNFNKKLLYASGKDFISFSVKKSSKGGLSLEPTIWKASDGGAKQFYFENKGNNVSKGTIKIAPFQTREDGREDIANGQYLNQKIALVQPKTTTTKAKATKAPQKNPFRYILSWDKIPKGKKPSKEKVVTINPTHKNNKGKVVFALEDGTTFRANKTRDESAQHVYDWIQENAKERLPYIINNYGGKQIIDEGSSDIKNHIGVAIRDAYARILDDAEKLSPQRAIFEPFGSEEDLQKQEEPDIGASFYLGTAEKAKENQIKTVFFSEENITNLFKLKDGKTFRSNTTRADSAKHVYKLAKERPERWEALKEKYFTQGPIGDSNSINIENHIGVAIVDTLEMLQQEEITDTILQEEEAAIQTKEAATVNEDIQTSKEGMTDPTKLKYKNAEELWDSNEIDKSIKDFLLSEGLTVEQAKSVLYKEYIKQNSGINTEKGQNEENPDDPNSGENIC